MIVGRPGEGATTGSVQEYCVPDPKDFAFREHTLLVRQSYPFAVVARRPPDSMVRIGKATDRTGFDKTSVRDYESPAAVRERPGDVAVEFSQFSGEVGDDAIRMLTNIGRVSAKASVERYLHVRRHGRQQFKLTVDGKSHRNTGFECARDRTGKDLVESRHSRANPPGKVNAGLREMLTGFRSHGVSSMLNESGGHSRNLVRRLFCRLRRAAIQRTRTSMGLREDWPGAHPGVFYVVETNALRDREDSVRQLR